LKEEEEEEDDDDDDDEEEEKICLPRQSDLIQSGTPILLSYKFS
jgi:hypothetical protein